MKKFYKASVLVKHNGAFSKELIKTKEAHNNHKYSHS